MNTPARLPHRQHQSGAALVVALILLAALSLMAISSMNTASLDLIMAGNEQYRSRAFVTAEAGVERGLIGPLDSSTPLTQTGTVGSDTFSYTVTPLNSGMPQAMPSLPAGSSMQGQGGFKAIYFSIASTGQSERGTTATNTQEIYRQIQSTDDVGYDSECGTADLDSTTSGC